MENKGKDLIALRELQGIFGVEIYDYAIFNDKGFVKTVNDIIFSHAAVLFKEQQAALTLTLDRHTIKTYPLNESESIAIAFHKDKMPKTSREEAVEGFLALSFLTGKDTSYYDAFATIYIEDDKVKSMNSEAARFAKDKKTVYEVFALFNETVRLTEYHHTMLATPQRFALNVTSKKTRSYCMEWIPTSDEKSYIILLSDLPKATVYNQFFNVFNQLQFGIFHVEVMNDDARFLYANKRYRTLMNSSRDSYYNKRMKEVFQNFPKSVFERIMKVSKTEESIVFRDHSVTLDKYFHVYMFSPNKHEVVGVYYETTDFFALKKQADDQLVKMQMMMSQAAMGFIEIDYKKRFLKADAFVEKLLGKENITYNDYRKIFHDCVHPQDYQRIKEENIAFIKGDVEHGTTMFRIKKEKNKHYRYVRYYVRALKRSLSNAPNKIVILVQDVHNEEVQKSRINCLANHDALTKLYNRHHFKQTTSSDGLVYPQTLITFDIDGLKVINDVFGHDKGDFLIRHFSELLRKHFKRSYIARMGGDEFLMLTRKPFKDLRDRLNKVEIALKQFDVDGLKTSVSLGYSVIHSKDDFSRAYKEAEDLMFRSKLEERPLRKKEHLTTLISVLNTHNTLLQKRIARMKPIAIQVLKEIGFSRRDEITHMAQVVDYYALGMVKSYLKESKTLDLKYLNILNDSCQNIHGEDGYKVLSNLIDNEKVAQAVLHQCEHFNGQGKPHGLSGRSIPLYSRVLCAVHHYDKLVFSNEFSKQHTPHEACEKIKELRGELFDPQVVSALIKVVYAHVNT